MLLCKDRCITGIVSIWSTKRLTRSIAEHSMGYLLWGRCRFLWPADDYLRSWGRWRGGLRAIWSCVNVCPFWVDLMGFSCCSFSKVGIRPRGIDRVLGISCLWWIWVFKWRLMCHLFRLGSRWHWSLWFIRFIYYSLIFCRIALVKCFQPRIPFSMHWLIGSFFRRFSGTLGRLEKLIVSFYFLWYFFYQLPFGTSGIERCSF